MILGPHPWILAAQHLRRHRLLGLAIVVGLAVALALPAFTVAVGRHAEDALLARAVDTPVVVGRRGNEFDLVMASLYFQGEVRETLPYRVAEALRAQDRGLVVPLHTGFTAGGAPLVGTSLAYLDRRGLEVADGRRPAILGEVVVGAAVAREAHLRPGDRLRSDQKNLYDLSGSYPLLLTVVGVLEPTGGPDDEAIFADIKTVWVLEGLLHGHEAVTEGTAQGATDDNLEASLALFVFAEITPETLASFHLHGDADDWPLTAVLVWPTDRRAHDQLLGDLAVDDLHQAVRPVEVVRTILGIVLRIQALLGAWVVLVGASTAALTGLVVSLVMRLRSPEIRLMRRLGAGRGTLAAVLGAEAVLLLVAALGLAALLTAGALAGVRAWLGW